MPNQMRSQGLGCPECDARIFVDILTLLSQGKVICPSCELELIVDQQKSADTLNILKELNNEIKSAYAYFEQAQYTEVSGHTSRRRKRREDRRRGS